jgi:hypothetical protein
MAIVGKFDHQPIDERVNILISLGKKIQQAFPALNDKEVIETVLITVGVIPKKLEMIDVRSNQSGNLDALVAMLVATLGNRAQKEKEIKEQ